jgi:hypothetical protein
MPPADRTTFAEKNRWLRQAMGQKAKLDRRGKRARTHVKARQGKVWKGEPY